MNKATFSGALAILMATGLTVAVDAQAQARERGVNERQQQQRERNSTGARSGEVARPAARQSNRETRGTERREQAHRSDGNFSRSERREVHRDLNRHGRQVQQSRNDHYRQGWHGGRDWGHQQGRQRSFGHTNHGQGGRGIDRRQQQQQAQIRQGIRSGSLTPHEARRLSMEQRQIARGILLTPGSFENGCRSLAQQSATGSLQLIDGERLELTAREIATGPLAAWWS